MASKLPLVLIGGIPSQSGVDPVRVKDGVGAKDAANLSQLSVVLMTAGAPGEQETLYDADGSIMTHYDPFFATDLVT